MELLWITNIATPYTAPVWRELGKLTDLHVACLARTESNRQWSVDLAGVEHTVLGARAIKAGPERTLYAPARGLVALFRRRPAVVVLDGWESPAFWQARLLARWFGARVVLSYWSTTDTHRFSSGPIAAFRRRWFRTADGVITPGPAASDAVRAMGVDEDRIITGFATVDVERFATETRAARQGLPRRRGHHFLYVGQLIPRKNIAALIQAFAHMHQEHDTFTVAGSGPLEAELRDRAERLGLGDVVRFCGHLHHADLVRIYAGADTLVLPSTEEVWGLVVNEALAAGLSVVVSDACGVARSIAQMPSVHITRPTQQHLTHALAHARQQGSRAGTAHPIVDLTPLALAARLATSLIPQQRVEIR